MPVDVDLISYNIASSLKTSFGVKISESTEKYMKNISKKISKQSSDNKLYYANYGMKLAKNLTDYLDGISFFEINDDPEHEVTHDFKLTWKKDNVSYISLSFSSVQVKDIIPEKLMKICKYRKNTKISMYYTSGYKKYSEYGYQKIKNTERYSELDAAIKQQYIIDPMCELVVSTLSKKRKCANILYNYLFTESDRIVFKLHKNRFMMYDFSKELEEVTSYRIKINASKNIVITFNNGTIFELSLRTNASEIKEHLSIKFRTCFSNMDDLYVISYDKV